MRIQSLILPELCVFPQLTAARLAIGPAALLGVNHFLALLICEHKKTKPAGHSYNIKTTPATPAGLLSRVHACMLRSCMNYGWGASWGVGAPPGYTDGTRRPQTPSLHLLKVK